ncbi:MAG: hypothetical protein A2W22_03185 [Candidatus Levybacteria bacterium RBG_16_35_11]|nr:MAG: hypothetical protein A2W22_03185 [Candidatus Levybacteria bacterium RBG_16_35_11]
MTTSDIVIIFYIHCFTLDEDKVHTQTSYLIARHVQDFTDSELLNVALDHFDIHQNMVINYEIIRNVDVANV